MLRPGEYLADRTEGITRVEDLPKAKIVQRSRNRSRRPCPECERSCYRHRTMQRRLHDLGDLVSERPRDIHITYSQHYCCKPSSCITRCSFRMVWRISRGKSKGFRLAVSRFLHFTVGAV
jgi:hypothetical protein